MKVRTEPAHSNFEPFNLVLTVENAREHQALRALANLNLTVAESISTWLGKQSKDDPFTKTLLDPFYGDRFEAKNEIAEILADIAGRIER